MRWFLFLWFGCDLSDALGVTSFTPDVDDVLGGEIAHRPRGGRDAEVPGAGRQAGGDHLTAFRASIMASAI